MTQRTCFVISPIGADDSPTRRAVDGLLNTVIAPVLDEVGLTLVVPHKLPSRLLITNEIIRQLLDADLVVAELSGRNPNVMYELGVRHSAGKPVVTIAQRGTELPFDIGAVRTIFYDPDFAGAVWLKTQLQNAVHDALSGDASENPVGAAISSKIVLERAREETTATSFVLERMERVESLISNLSKQLEHTRSRPRRHTPTDAAAGPSRLLRQKHSYAQQNFGSLQANEQKIFEKFMQGWDQNRIHRELGEGLATIYRVYYQYKATIDERHSTLSNESKMAAEG